MPEAAGRAVRSDKRPTRRTSAALRQHLLLVLHGQSTTLDALRPTCTRPPSEASPHKIARPVAQLFSPADHHRSVTRAPPQQLIAFFILLNALLAIIVESHDRTKAEAELEKMINPDTLIVKQIFGLNKDPALPANVSIDSDELLKLFADITANMKVTTGCAASDTNQPTKLTLSHSARPRCAAGPDGRHTSRFASPCRGRR